MTHAALTCGFFRYRRLDLPNWGRLRTAPTPSWVQCAHDRYARNPAPNRALGIPSLTRPRNAEQPPTSDEVGGWLGRRVWAVSRRFLVLSSLGAGLAAVAWIVAPGLADEGGGSSSCETPGADETALWIGDSYTRGTGIDTADAYSCLVSQKLGWDRRLDAVGSTGYYHSAGGESLPYRLDDTITRVPDPGVVIVDSGRNDANGYGEENVERQATNYLIRVVEAWPDARVVVLLPWDAADTSAMPHPTADVIRAAAESAGVTEIIDPVGLGIAGGAPGMVVGDGIHPNEAGHCFVAERLTDALGG